MKICRLLQLEATDDGYFSRVDSLFVIHRTVRYPVVVFAFVRRTKRKQSCLVVEKEEKLRVRASPGHLAQAFSFPSVVFTVCCVIIIIIIIMVIFKCYFSGELIALS